MSSSEIVTEPEAINGIITDMRMYAEQLDFSESVVDTALEIYMQSYENNLYNGRSIQSILGAAIYISCRLNNVARRPKTISDTVDCTENNLINTVQHFSEHLDIMLKPSTPLSYVEEFFDELSNISEETQTIAAEIADKSYTDPLFSGRSAAGLAAGSIYAASQITGDSVNQSRLKEISDVSTVTIRKNYPQLQEQYKSAY
jgi:transcription initiation factor TFIIB